MISRASARKHRVQKVAPKIECKPDLRYQRRRRGNSRYLVIFLLLVVFVAGLGYGATTLMRRTKFFNLTRFEITGNRSVPLQTYQQALTVFYNHNLFTVSARDVRRQLQRIVRVDHVKVAWSLPDGLKISVSERSTAFQVKTVDGDIFPVDSTAVVLDELVSGPVEDAPLVDVNLSSDRVVEGEVLESNTLQRAMKLHREINRADREFAERISEYYDKNGDLYFVEGESGARVVMGEDRISDKLPRLVFFAENVGFTSGQTVDLRYKDQIVMRTGE